MVVPCSKAPRTSNTDGEIRGDMIPWQTAMEVPIFRKGRRARDEIDKSNS